MARRILIVDFPKQQAQFTETNRVVSITLSWNTVARAWFADLAIDGVKLVSGSKIVALTDIFDEYQDAIFFARNSSLNDFEITYDSLINGNTRLYWYTTEEAQAIEDPNALPVVVDPPVDCDPLPAAPIYPIDNPVFTALPVTLDPTLVSGGASVVNGDLSLNSGGGGAGFGGAFVTANARDRDDKRYFWQTVYASANGPGQDRNRVGITTYDQNDLAEGGPEQIVSVDSAALRVLVNLVDVAVRTGNIIEVGSIVNHKLDLVARTYEISVDNTTSYEVVASGLAAGPWFPYMFGSRSTAGLVGSQQHIRILESDLSEPVPAGYQTWDIIALQTPAELAAYLVALAAYQTERDAIATCEGCGAIPVLPANPTQIEIDAHVLALNSYAACIGCPAPPVDPGPITALPPVLLDPTTEGGQSGTPLTYSSDLLTITAGTANRNVLFTDNSHQTTGQWYWETIYNANAGQATGSGIQTGLNQNYVYLGQTSGGYGIYEDGAVYNSASNFLNVGGVINNGDTLRHKLDLDSLTYEVALEALPFVVVSAALSGTDWKPACTGGDAGDSLTFVFDPADFKYGTDGFDPFVDNSGQVTRAEVEAYLALVKVRNECLGIDLS